jgi:hypothetical protein
MGLKDFIRKDRTADQQIQDLFDAFVSQRKLDIEFDNWSKQDEQDWATLVGALRELQTSSSS